MTNKTDDSDAKYAIVPQHSAGQRFDKVVAQLFPEYSRSTLQKWMKQGRILLDEELPKQKDKVQGGEPVEVFPAIEMRQESAAQPVPIDIIHRDAEIMVINKPSDLVVHPGAGNLDNTLLNGLLYIQPELRQLPRVGIVHRLDKDTSGLMVVATNESARLHLIEQLDKQSMGRSYLALVLGDMISGCSVDEPIGRDPKDRRRMMIRDDGRQALTHIRVIRRFGPITQVCCCLETGRTHQIRVHLRHIGFPIVGDPVYGGKRKIPAGISDALRKQLAQFKRQALHATELSLIHPGTNKPMCWHVDPPADFRYLMDGLAREFADE